MTNHTVGPTSTEVVFWDDALAEEVHGEIIINRPLVIDGPGGILTTEPTPIFSVMVLIGKPPPEGEFDHRVCAAIEVYNGYLRVLGWDWDVIENGDGPTISEDVASVGVEALVIGANKEGR